MICVAQHADKNMNIKQTTRGCSHFRGHLFVVHFTSHHVFYVTEGFAPVHRFIKDKMRWNFIDPCGDILPLQPWKNGFQSEKRNSRTQQECKTGQMKTVETIWNESYLSKIWTFVGFYKHIQSLISTMLQCE